ncbi:MAG TPA: hypothetical protein VMG35_26720 [Bryobacteraceae bacterium]|nr:hypothetical protein [Bryobacteraceae bacterium]
MKLLHYIFLLAVAAEIGVPAFLGVPMVKTELDRGIAMANVAASEVSVFYTRAEEVYVKVQTLLPKINGLSRDDRAALRMRVTDLRMALDLVPGAEPAFPQPATNVSGVPPADL